MRIIALGRGRGWLIVPDNPPLPPDPEPERVFLLVLLFPFSPTPILDEFFPNDFVVLIDKRGTLSQSIEIFE